MEIKYSKSFLSKIEDVFAESDYTLRYEKGNFKSGYCVLDETKIVVVNKYYSLEGKINSLVEILQQISLNNSNFTEKTRVLYNQLRQTKLNIKS